MKLPKSLNILANYLDDRGEVFWYSNLTDRFIGFDRIDDLIDEKLETW